MSELTQTCLHCIHANFEPLWREGLKWFAICAKDEKWRYHAPELGCSVGKFEVADSVVLDKRIRARKKAA